MAARRLSSEDTDEEEFQNQYEKLQHAYRHAREDRREHTLEKKDQLRMQQ